MKKYVLAFSLFAGLAGALASQSVAQIKPNKFNFTPKDLELRAAMSKLMNDHVTWHRIFAVEAITNSPDADKARDRLNRNLNDLGNAFKPFYGDDTAGKVSDLLKQRVQLLANYLTAAKAGQNTWSINSDLMANADATAALLSQKNFDWKQDELSALFRDHVNDLKAEIDQQVKRPGALDIPQLDKTSDHAETIAETLAAGLINQFPDKLR